MVHRLKKVWNKDNPIFYATAAPQKPDKWLKDEDRGTKYFWCDYSMFDNTQSEDTWAFIEPSFHNPRQMTVNDVLIYVCCCRRCRHVIKAGQDKLSQTPKDALGHLGQGLPSGQLCLSPTLTGGYEQLLLDPKKFAIAGLWLLAMVWDAD